jgi:Raf kinase inhibitor-like YbhB/YbcL family protein
MSRTFLFTVFLLACCGPRQQEVTDTMSTTTAVADVTVTSPAFITGGEIPKQYGCAGESLSPPLSFAGVPAGTKSLALIMTDPDAPGGLFTHWVVWNIPPDKASIAEGRSPGGSEGKNSFGKRGYGAPCPPTGSHRYIFDVYALDTTLDLAPGAGREDVENAMRGHVLAKGQTLGTYRK